MTDYYTKSMRLKKINICLQLVLCVVVVCIIVRQEVKKAAMPEPAAIQVLEELPAEEPSDVNTTNCAPEQPPK